VRDTSRKYGALPLKEKPEEEHWRKAFTSEREGAAQAYCLSLRDADGRTVAGFALSLYLRHWWLDGGGRMERLFLLFNGGAMVVEGWYFQRGVDALEEGKLKRIQVQDAEEISAIKSRNADVRKLEDKEPIVCRAVVFPALEQMLEADENLAALAQALKEAKMLKEDHAHHAGTDKELA